MINHNNLGLGEVKRVSNFCDTIPRCCVETVGPVPSQGSVGPILHHCPVLVGPGSCHTPGKFKTLTTVSSKPSLTFWLELLGVVRKVLSSHKAQSTLRALDHNLCFTPAWRPDCYLLTSYQSAYITEIITAQSLELLPSSIQSGEISHQQK